MIFDKTMIESSRSKSIEMSFKDFYDFRILTGLTKTQPDLGEFRAYL